MSRPDLHSMAGPPRPPTDSATVQPSSTTNQPTVKQQANSSQELQNRKIRKVTSKKTQLTGGYGFAGLVAHHHKSGVGGEALGIVGYDTKEGKYAGTLAGGGSSFESDFGIASTLHGVTGGGAVSANEKLYFFGSKKSERNASLSLKWRHLKFGVLSQGLEALSIRMIRER